jgi:hypothetical protein
VEALRTNVLKQTGESARFPLGLGEANELL